MKSNRLRQLYQQHLIRFGVQAQKAEQAANTLTEKELSFIAQIWPDWSKAFYEANASYLGEGRCTVRSADKKVY